MARDKVKKKKWIEVIAPKMFNEQVVGETYLVDANHAVGRTIKINLMDLSSDARRQNTEMEFKIVQIREGKALTVPLSYKMASSSIRRMVRRDKEKIEDSLVCLTADNMEVRIKLFIITRFAVKNSVLSAVRKLAQTNIKAEVKKIKFIELLQTVVSGKLQKSIMVALGKIYPLKVFLIKEVKIIKGLKTEYDDKPTDKKKAGMEGKVDEELKSDSTAAPEPDSKAASEPDSKATPEPDRKKQKVTANKKPKKAAKSSDELSPDTDKKVYEARNEPSPKADNKGDVDAKTSD
ncbi:MAG: hypothetical protein ABIC04_05545 [Nanoarchaeota archaeon]